ncbi:cell division control protein 53 [Trichomonascus vanleenenianus]|uniref:cullin CDC53 n=1 Tax=Trichomonascus vanleenenianus TaxID=2268995 RepID=UPI003ECB5DC7
MDYNPDDAKSTWQFIEAGINKILVDDLTEGISKENYIQIYTAIHNFCVSVNSNVGGRGAPVSQVGAYGIHRGAQLLGADLYHQLEQYLTRHLTALRGEALKHEGPGLIDYYNRIWERYTIGAGYVNHIFNYLNRHWVRREREEGRRHIYDVNTLCLVRWRDVLFEAIKQRLTQAILRQIERQRNGEAVATSNIKHVIQSYVSLGLDDTQARKENLKIYNEDLRRPFIEDTRAYYREESRAFLAANSVVEYLKKANARIEEETARVQLYLHPSTENSLMEACNEILISDHAGDIQVEFQRLLAEDRQQDCHLLYKLLSRVEGLLVPVQDALQEYVQKQGLAAVSALKKETVAAGTPLDAMAYVQTLLRVQAKYSDLVRSAFELNPGLVQALDNGCKAYINHNDIAGPLGRESKTPELLAKYSDMLLKKSSKQANEDTDIDEALNGIMTVFQYIEAKDAFEKFYKRLLSKRLVHNTSLSEDAETNMVSKLKEACGYEYTNHLQRMFQDMQTSAEMQSQFKATLSKEDSAIDFAPAILAENYWPLPDFRYTYNMPQELHPVFERFQGFFNKKHSGRKLKWLWNVSKGEIKANLPGAPKAGYNFSVSSYQTAILMPFNRKDEYSHADLQSITGLPDDLFNSSMVYLLKARLLIQSPADKAPGPDVSYAVNLNFKSKKVRINLNLPLKSEQKQETEQTQKNIEDDRKMFLQAVIVRVMKARKELRSVQLIQETIEQSKKRFSPKISEIKKSIDSLVDKEYLERVDGSKLRYLA